MDTRNFGNLTTTYFRATFEYVTHSNTNMRGGKRVGAGRKSLYNSPTKVVRVPADYIDQVKSFLENGSTVAFPFFECSMSANLNKKIDLNTHLVNNPTSTFFVRASGDSMINAGIYDGDLLIVDRSIKAEHGKVVIASLNGDLTVKRLTQKNGGFFLTPENPRYRTIELGDDIGTVIWGVVTNVIHKV